MGVNMMRAAARRRAWAAIAVGAFAAGFLVVRSFDAARSERKPEPAETQAAGGDVARAKPDSQAAGAVVPGVEVLIRDSLHLIRGKRVGLITNHTGRDRAGRSTIDILFRTPGVQLVALYGPEHGLRGQARGGERLGASVDSATGVRIHSLYGTRLSPTPAMLEGVDVLLYDIQDVGARAYTYVWTMALAARAAGRPFIVLDRPNPIRADVVEGDTIEPRFRTFTGLHPVPMRYGLTPGEVLRWLAGTGRVQGDFRVIPMDGYRRSMWYDETGLPWVGPSPNIPDVATALQYAGTVLFEATNLSEGRGTAAPLRQVGAPWLTDAAEIAAEMNALALPGVRFDATTDSVRAGEEYGGRRIPMIAITVTNRDSVRMVDAAARLTAAIRRRHPAEFAWRGGGIEELTGSVAFRRAIEGRRNLDSLLTAWRATSDAFARSTEQYRLYR